MIEVENYCIAQTMKKEDLSDKLIKKVKELTYEKNMHLLMVVVYYKYHRVANKVKTHLN